MPISPDRCKSRVAHSRHKNRAPSCDFRSRKLLARGLAAAPQFALRAHPSRPLRGGRIVLVGEPDGFAAGAFRQTESNCSTSGSTSAGLSVRTPFSKLRLRSRDLLRPLRGSVATLLRATQRLRRGRIRLLRMNEPQFDASLQHPVQYLQKRHHVPPPRIDVHIFDVRSDSSDFHFAKAPRADLAAAPQFGLRPHPTRPFRGGRIALVGQPDCLRRQANVAIHNLSLACGTIPQTTEV